MALFAFCWAMIAYSIYQLLQVGTCASGGPYVIARECPGGIGWLMFGMIGSILGLFVALSPTAPAARRPTPGAQPTNGGIVIWFWTGLFWSLAVGCFLGVWGPEANPGPGGELGGLIVGFMGLRDGGRRAAASSSSASRFKPGGGRMRRGTRTRGRLARGCGLQRRVAVLVHARRDRRVGLTRSGSIVAVQGAAPRPRGGRAAGRGRDRGRGPRRGLLVAVPLAEPLVAFDELRDEDGADAEYSLIQIGAGSMTTRVEWPRGIVHARRGLGRRAADDDLRDRAGAPAGDRRGRRLRPARGDDRGPALVPPALDRYRRLAAVDVLGAALGEPIEVGIGTPEPVAP